MELLSQMEYSSEKELKEHWTSHNKQIIDLRDFYNDIVPKDFEVYINQDNDSIIDFWVFEPCDTAHLNRIVWFQQWSINPFDYQEKSSPWDSSFLAPKTNNLDYILDTLNWNKNTFVEIREKLYSAGCNSIQNGEPTEIGFKFSGYGKYYYILFKNPLREDEIKHYNDSCTFRYYNDTVVWGYRGGAIGPQCFPDK